MMGKDGMPSALTIFLAIRGTRRTVGQGDYTLDMFLKKFGLKRTIYKYN